MKTWAYLGDYNAESTTITTFAGTGPTLFNGEAGKYTPPVDGTLIGIRTQTSADAATTLIELVGIKLTCTLWKIPCVVYAQGEGLDTAPRLEAAPKDFSVNLPLKTTQPITLEGANITADTPVGVRVHVFGLIEYNG